MIQTSSRISMPQSQDLCGFFRDQFISKEESIQLEEGSEVEETNINIPVGKLKKLTSAQRKICFEALQNIENAKLEDFRPKKIGKEDDEKISKVKEKEKTIDLDKDDEELSPEQKMNATILEIKDILSKRTGIEGDSEIHFEDKKTNKIKKKFQAFVNSIASFVKGVFVTIYNFVTRQVSAESLKKKMITHCKNAQKAEATFKKNELTLQELQKQKFEKAKILKSEIVLQTKYNEILDVTAQSLNGIASGESIDDSFNKILSKVDAIHTELSPFYEDTDGFDAKEGYDSEQADNYGLSSLNRFIKNYSEENELLQYKYNRNPVNVKSEMFF